MVITAVLTPLVAPGVVAEDVVLDFLASTAGTNSTLIFTFHPISSSYYSPLLFSGVGTSSQRIVHFSNTQSTLRFSCWSLLFEPDFSIYGWLLNRLNVSIMGLSRLPSF